MRIEEFNCESLSLGKNVKIADDVIITGGKIEIGDSTLIRSGTKINVIDQFKIGKNSIIGEKNIINGRKILIDREFYSNHHAEIGGGSCFENTSSLKIGYWFHIGSYSIINTAMPVAIGNEVGMGRFTNIYTHGVYLSALDGFPVSFGPITIGNRVWIPSATVNPGVEIGDDVVIGVGSIVTENIKSNSLAIGSPCKVIKDNFYPQKLSVTEKEAKLDEIFRIWKIDFKRISELIYECYNAVFDFKEMRIEGKISKESERTRNILRRNGIRFKIDVDETNYKPWARDSE